MSEGPAADWIVGQRVRVVPERSDVYYGTLVAADAAFVVLKDYIKGRHGDSGWWGHGAGERIAFPTAQVRLIEPSDWKPPR